MRAAAGQIREKLTETAPKAERTIIVQYATFIFVERGKSATPTREMREMTNEMIPRLNQLPIKLEVTESRIEKEANEGPNIKRKAWNTKRIVYDAAIATYMMTALSARRATSENAAKVATNNANMKPVVPDSNP